MLHSSEGSLHLSSNKATATAGAGIKLQLQQPAGATGAKHTRCHSSTHLQAKSTGSQPAHASARPNLDSCSWHGMATSATGQILLKACALSQSKPGHMTVLQTNRAIVLLSAVRREGGLLIQTFTAAYLSTTGSKVTAQEPEPKSKRLLCCCHPCIPSAS